MSLALSLLALILLWLTLRAAFRDSSWLAYAFFLRVPLFMALLLLVFPFAALGSGTLGNLLVMGFRGYLALAFFAPLLTWIIGLTATIIWRRGPERFQVARPECRWLTGSLGETQSEPPIRARDILWFSISTAPLLAVALTESVSVRDEAPWAHLGAGVLGFACSCAALWIIERATRGLVRGGGLKWVSGLVRPVFRRFPGLKPGYMDDQLHYLPGHGAAFVLTGFLSLLYTAGALFFHPAQPRWLQLPTLHYVLVLCMLLVAALAGITFFFDRFRFPVVAVLAIAVLGFNAARGLDYRFFIWQPNAPAPQGMSARPRDFEPATPVAIAERLRAGAPVRAGAEKPVLVVVAAAGGGIQAATWTTLVLTGLQRELGPDFGRSIGLISGVSGGSVGAMYYVAAFLDGKPPDVGVEPGPLFAAASESSLDATVWGMVFRDLPRLFSLGAGPRQDRAWAMEQDWDRAWDLMNRAFDPSAGRRLHAIRFSHWIADVKDGMRPAIIMNAMVAETSERLLIGSTALSKSPEDALSFQEFCCSGFPPADIDVVTGARVSATFPYITPMARAAWKGGAPEESFRLPDQRMADGGYYDNLGVLTAVQWLDEALERHADGFDRVLVIEIDAFAERSSRAPGLAGLMAETLGPFLAVLNARVPVQRARNRMVLDALVDKHGSDLIRSVILRPLEGVKVLSWHLSPSEKQSLKDEWEKLRCTDAVRSLEELFPASDANPHRARPCV